jgi:uncharacterized membrane-anchored protein
MIMTRAPLHAAGLVFACLLAFSPVPTLADAAPEPAAPSEAPSVPQSEAETPPALDTSDPHFGLNYQQGSFDVGSNLATVTTKQGFSYLDGANARRLLVDLWGNPPQAAEGILGAIVPTDVSLLSPESWAAIISYEASGHVSDDDAASIDYDELLAQMKEEAAANNEERKKLGYDTVDLIGWAEPPHYEQPAHKIYWAKHLRFQNSTSDTLNYFVRALGRQGVLELNVIADMTTLQGVSKQSGDLLAMVDFKPGERYEDFNPETDEVAAYGLAGLIAGGVAAKAGLFKGLIAILAASWKFIAIGAVAVLGVLGGVIKRFFGGNSQS